jgi:hypothetical protein
MARNVSIATLIEDTRRWANIRTSTPDDAHLTDADVARVLELKLAEFHELLTSATASAFLEEVETVAITGDSPEAFGFLPEGFFRLNAAWVEWSTTDHESISNLSNQQDATLYKGLPWTSGAPKAFRVVGAFLYVYPAAPIGTEIKISYVPAFVSADEYDGVNGWEKYVTMGAALELMAIENRTNPKLEAEYARQDERVRSMVEERQAQDAPMVRDVSASRGARWGSGTGGP